MTFALIWAVGVLLVGGAIYTMPSWCFAELVLIKLRQLRADVLDDIIDGHLPRNKQVHETVESLELTITHYKRFRLSDIWALGLLAREIPYTKPADTTDVSDQAMTDDEHELLTRHADRFSTLRSGLFMTSTWLGVATVLWFYAGAGFSGARGAVEAAGQTPLGQTAQRNAQRARRLAHHHS